MRVPPVSLREEDYDAGAHTWLGSRALRTVTAAFGAVAAAAWLVGLVCSIASWPDDAVLVPGRVLVNIAAFTAMPALLWLAGNLFRIMRLGDPSTCRRRSKMRP